MLLNIVKGPRSFDEIKTVNGITHPTYKAACYALGLLERDKEWHEAINQATQWATGVQIQKLFVVILMFCEISEPLKLWENNWHALSEEILARQRKLLRFQD